MNDLNLVAVTALAAFTKTTPHGQFHGDPDSKRNARPEVPDYVVDELVAARLISTDPLDHDGVDGKGGSEKGARSTRARGARKAKAKASAGEPLREGDFEAKHIGFGKYEITGPGLDEPEKVKGKDKAQARLAELEAAHAETAADSPAD